MHDHIQTRLHLIFPHSKYLSYYIKIVQHIQNERPTKNSCKLLFYWCETHHIVPRCLGPDLVRDKTNLVHCTPREHFLLHKLLMHASKGTPHLSKMRAAVVAFARNGNNQNRRFTSRDYFQLRALAYENARDNGLLSKKGSDNPFFGRRHSTETKQCIASQRTGSFVEQYGAERALEIRRKMQESRSRWTLPCSNEKREKISQSHRGKRWITNGASDLVIKNDAAIPSGWYHGRTNGSRSGANNRFSSPLTDAQRQKAEQTKQRNAVELAEKHRLMFQQAITSGAKTPYAIALYLNDAGYTTARGRQWQFSTVKSTLIKLAL